MPIFEYSCTSCAHEFETIQGIKEAPLIKCPTCEANTLQKKLSAAAFHLKGTGWYETDFKNKNKDAGDKEKSSNSEKSTTETAKSESKTEGASDKKQSKPEKGTTTSATAA